MKLHSGLQCDSAILEGSHLEPPLACLKSIHSHAPLEKLSNNTIESADCGHPEIKTKYKLEHQEPNWSEGVEKKKSRGNQIKFHSNQRTSLKNKKQKTFQLSRRLL